MLKFFNGTKKQQIQNLLVLIVIESNRDYDLRQSQKVGLSRDLNPGPPAPKAGIIPLDH